VSYTTRPPRGKEKSGRNYHFISREEFEERIQKGEFLEYAQVFGNYYGTHCGELEAAAAEGQDLILDIDVQGAAQLKSRLPEAVTIFVLAPSRQILEKRLRARGEDEDSVIERRLRDAAREIQGYCAYDYIVVNQEIEESAATLISIVRAERVRRVRMEDRLKPILATFDRT
jgi:guanylate kinase